MLPFIRRKHSTNIAVRSPAPGPTDPSFAQVVLLLGFEGADGSTTVTDESGFAHGTASVSGNAQIDTAQFKYGASSALFDGTGDAFRFADSSDWLSGTGNFTIECFYRTTTIAAGTRILFGQWSSVPNLGWYLWNDTAQMGMQVSVSGSDSFTVAQSSAGAIATNTWYHIAADYNGTKYRIYIDGVMVGSSTTARNIANSNLELVLGSNAAVGSFFLNGWLDEVRITKGTARYASDGGFTPPSALFPRS
jgi:hypothetical protein